MTRNIKTDKKKKSTSSSKLYIKINTIQVAALYVYVYSCRLNYDLQAIVLLFPN